MGVGNLKKFIYYYGREVFNQYLILSLFIEVIIIFKR